MPNGESNRQVVILDDEPSFFVYEHNLKNPDTGKYGLMMECIEQDDVCPICEASGTNSAYNMYLTVLDLKPFTTTKGESVPYSRKLFLVKSQQQKKFLRRFEKEGTLRGAIFELSRDGDKSPVIGNDIEFAGFMDEDELLEYERSYQKDGKRVVEKCHEPYDYDEFFPEVDRATLIEQYESFFGDSGLDSSIPGSSKANSEEEVPPRARRGRKADVDDEDDDDDVPVRSRRGRKSKVEEDDDEPPYEVEEADDEEEEERPRPRAKAKARPSARPTRRPTRAVDDDDDDDDDDAPPARRPRRPSARRSR
jgi:hypothetical protein